MYIIKNKPIQYYSRIYKCFVASLWNVCSPVRYSTRQSSFLLVCICVHVCLSLNSITWINKISHVIILLWWKTTNFSWFTEPAGPAALHTCVSANKQPSFPGCVFWEHCDWFEGFFRENKSRLLISPNHFVEFVKLPTCFFFFLSSLFPIFFPMRFSVSPAVSSDPPVALGRHLCLTDTVIQPNRPVNRLGLSGSEERKCFSPPSDAKQRRRCRRRPHLFARVILSQSLIGF